MRVAKPWNPILVAGGGIEGGADGVAQPQTDFIHNSARPLDGTVHASGVADGNIVLMTEEDFTTPCDQGGRIVAADITDSLGGEPATNSTPAQPYRMKALSAFHPTQDAPDTAAPITGCSAHYFELSGSTVAAGWYGQGLRLIDALQRSQPPAGRLLLRHRDGRGEPELALLGHRLARRSDLPLRHGARDRDPPLEGRVRRRCEVADGAVAAGEALIRWLLDRWPASRRTRSSVPCSRCRTPASQIHTAVRRNGAGRPLASLADGT